MEVLVTKKDSEIMAKLDEGYEIVADWNPKDHDLMPDVNGCYDVVLMRKVVVKKAVKKKGKK